MDGFGGRAGLSRRAALTGLLAASGAAVPARAALPGGTMRIISPFTPGGLNDICSRAIARGLHDSLGKTVIVENMPGANTLIGMQYVAQAPADGNVLVAISDTNMTYLPALLKKPPVDLVGGFAPVTLVCTSPMVLVTRPDLGLATAGDLIAFLKAQPGKLTYGSAGIGTSPHMTAELFKLKAGVDMVHVPYKGVALAMTDVSAGHVDLMFVDAGSGSALIKGGKLRAIGIAQPARAAQFPDLATISESGLPDFVSRLWIGMAVRSGTPRAAVDELNAAIRACLQRPDLATAVASTGADVTTDGADEFADMMAKDRARFADVVKATGISLAD